MSYARCLHTATPVQNDQILIAGGLDQNSNLVGQTEIYSDAAQTFSLGPQLQVPRAWHTATLLGDGTVLIAGGQNANGNAIASAEIYDPVANTTTSVGKMVKARMKHSATLLANGTVFIFGGTSSLVFGPSFSDGEIYNPQTKSFSTSGSVAFGYQSQAAALLSNDQVLLVTGYADSVQNMMLCTLSECSQSQSPADVAYNPALVPLFNTSGPLALLASGQNSFLFDGKAPTFTDEAIMLEQRTVPEAVLIQNTNTTYDGSVLVGGGVKPNTGSSNGTTLEVNNPQNNAWSSAGNLTVARTWGTMTFIGATPISSKVVLSSSANPQVVGAAVTFTAVVSSNAPVMSGNVAFMDGGTTIGNSAVNQGTASFQTSSLSVGQHEITAVYSGGIGVGGGTSNTVVQIVNPAQAVSVQLSSSLNPSQPGTLVTFTATVKGTGSTPTGTAVFEDGATVLGTSSLVGGVATLATSSLAAGTHSITAVYNGDSNYGSASSSPLAQNVAALITPTVTLSVTPTEAKAGSPITFTATVSSLNGPIPTGSITISDSTNANNRYGSADLVNGVGVVTNSQIAPGTYTVIATYGGDGGVNYVGAQSNVVSFTIDPVN